MDASSQNSLRAGLARTTAGVAPGGPFTGVRLTPAALPASSRGGLPRKPKAGSGVRAFAYTRYSTAPQEVKSEERQLLDIRAYAEGRHKTVVRAFSDRALTGTSMVERKGLQAMMEAARRRECDLVVVEDLDRLSRALPDLMAIFYELRLLGVELHDIQNGKLDLIHIVMRGYMAEEGRVRFLAMSEQGKRLAIQKGKAMAKTAFGFLRHAKEKGVLVPHPVTAAVVVRIFEMIAQGVAATSVARLLTNEGVLAPAQSLQADNGEPPLVPKPWHGNAVLKIVRNHLYIGLVSWGRSKAVYDGGRRKRVGYEATDEDGWLVLAFDHLRLVDEDLWARANLRLSNDGQGGRMHAGHLLLTAKAVCGCCGANLASESVDGLHRYRCTRRLRAGADACPAKEWIRVDWLEHAVITALCAHAASGREAELADAYDAELRRLLAHDVERARVVGARIDKLQRMYKANLEESDGRGSTTEAGIRRAWRDEIDTLEEELKGLRRPEQFASPSLAFESLSGHFEDLLRELPFRPNDAAGIALKQALRDVVAAVRVHRPDADGRVAVEIDVDPLAAFRGESGGAGALDAPALAPALAELEAPLAAGPGLRPTTLHAHFHPAKLRKAERDARDTGGAASLREAAEIGFFELQDEDWAVVADLFENVDAVVDGRPHDMRRVLDGMICVCRTGGSRDRVPERYGGPVAFRRLAKRVVYARVWDEAVERLRAASPHCLLGADLGKFDNTEYPRRLTGTAPDAKRAKRDRKRLLQLAALEPAADEVRIRYEVVADILGGARVCDAARQRGLSDSCAYHYWDDYKKEGVEGLMRKTGKPPARNILDAAQVAMLGDIARTGVHPQDDRFLTYPILVDLVLALFGRRYSRQGMVQLCNREGFGLRPHVVAAKRRRSMLGTPDASTLPSSTWSPEGRALSLEARRGTAGAKSP